MRHFVEVTRVFRTLNSFEVLDQISDAELPPVLIKQAGGFQVSSAQYQNIQPPQGVAPDVDAALVRVKQAAARSVEQHQGCQVRSSLLFRHFFTKIYPFVHHLLVAREAQHQNCARVQVQGCPPQEGCLPFLCVRYGQLGALQQLSGYLRLLLHCIVTH
jgi:hypothetical protein